MIACPHCGYEGPHTKSECIDRLKAKLENLESADRIDTSNDCFVGMAGQNIVFALPLPARMDKAKALRLAAYIVALADDDDKFPALLEAIKNL